MMKRVVLALAMVCSFLATTVNAQETLMNKLKKAKFDGMIGTWVDEGTGGKVTTMTVKWKFKNRVIEIMTKDPNNESVSLMGINGQNGTIFHMGADKNGTSSLGEWKMTGEGSALLSFGFTSEKGEQGGVQIQHKMLGKDKMKLTIQGPQPINLNMVRKK